jgi:hypothetical protein
VIKPGGLLTFPKQLTKAGCVWRFTGAFGGRIIAGAHVVSLHMKRIFSQRSSPQTHLPSDELGHILQRVDENLTMSPLLHKPHEDIDSSMVLPISDLFGRLHELKQMRAPLFVIKGRDIRNQLKRLLNIPIRVLNHKQIRFNRDLLELLTLLMAALQRSYQHTQSQVQAGNTLMAQQQLQASQQIIEALNQQIHQQSARIDQLERELLSLREAISLLQSQHLNVQEQDPHP